MTTMISEVYDAFRKAGVPEEAARKAAEALSAENLATKTDIQRIDKEMLVLMWMIGFNLAFTMVILWKVFSVCTKSGS
ncbi:MAG: integrase [Gammaproteobacteria bacterium]|nr:integrase [Gammaproteobacteria bacterium]